MLSVEVTAAGRVSLGEKRATFHSCAVLQLWGVRGAPPLDLLWTSSTWARRSGTTLVA